MKAKQKDIREPKFLIEIAALASVFGEILISSQCYAANQRAPFQSSPYPIIVPSCRGKSLFHFRMRTQKLQLKWWWFQHWVEYFVVNGKDRKPVSGDEKRWHQWWVAWNFSTCHCRVECSDRMSERIYATLWVLFLSQNFPLLDENNIFLKCELDSCEHSTNMITRLMTRCRCLFTFRSSQKDFWKCRKNATRKSAQDAWMGWRPKGVQKKIGGTKGSALQWYNVICCVCFTVFFDSMAWLQRTKDNMQQG